MPKEKASNDKPHEMLYNTQQPHLIIPEYGRNIQKLVQYTCTLKSKEERNNMAHAIIAIMGRLNPQLRDILDFRHKLWDHLFIISNFKLDVESPYPVPSKEILTTKPDRVKYPSARMKFKHYGKAVELLIEKATGMKSGEEKTAFIEAIANLMKKSYLVWNRDTVSDGVIFEELEELSKGKLKVPENFRLTSTYDILAKTKGINNRDDRAGERRREGGGGGRDNRGRDNRGGRNNGGRHNNNRRRGR